MTALSVDSTSITVNVLGLNLETKQKESSEECDTRIKVHILRWGDSTNTSIFS